MDLQSPRRELWQTARELPDAVFQAWRKPNRALSPVAIVATVDPDGTPHTAPFGSLRAITPRVLRLCSLRAHATYANLCRDGRACVMLLSPDVAVSVCGRARVVKEKMDHDENFAILEIDIAEVKNDMVYRITIESGIAIRAKERWQPWYAGALAEVEGMNSSFDESKHSA
ncbi:MAG: pyridoxamine 5'-phosphate oxidase family protein [Anaerolineales bacterium]|nr:pyridoxamine 5'-phosphate oxidase family protein [Anaerolineales bacterium]